MDLDGTLSQWPTPGMNSVLDGIGPPIPRMVARVIDLLDDGWWVKIFTARVGTGGSEEELQRAMITDWLLKVFGERHHFDITNAKDHHCIQIYDDRAVTIIANTGKTPWDNP